MVVDGLMIVTSENQAYALDASDGHEIWHFPRVAKGGNGEISASNRGVAVLGNKIVGATPDAHLIVLNRVTGRPA